MSTKPIYLDYMATTPVDPLVIEKMVKYLGPEGIYGNPSSNTHSYGTTAAKAVEHARSLIAQTIQARTEEIIFTSGATEADNLALLGAAHFYQTKGKHIITMSTEHKAVLDTCHQLEKEGFEVTYLDPEPDGLLNLKKLEQALRLDTILVSIMQVNNEIGIINDLAAIGKILHKKGVIFHVDAAQSIGKVAVDLSTLPVDLMSLSAHKSYGPKGIGALFVRHKPRIRLQPISFGGGHEGGMRSGTLPTHQIVGMGAAFELAESLRKQEQARILEYRNILWDGIKQLPQVRLNGDEHQRVAGNLNICFEGLEGDALLLALKDLAISNTSACSSASIQPSYVLRALGLTQAQAQASLRISIGRFTTREEVERARTVICQQITQLYENKTL